jgi:biofilm PGA synthesis protein PgaD
MALPSSRLPPRVSRRRPGPVSAGPLIIEASLAQTRVQRRVSGMLATLGWLAWVMLWLPLATLAVWAFFATQMLAPAREELRRHLADIASPFVVGLGLSAALLAWALYNRWRFGARRRRRAARRAESRDIAREMHFDDRQVRQCWWRRRIVVHHDEQGRLVMLEASLRRPELPRRKVPR